MTRAVAGPRAWKPVAKVAVLAALLVVAFHMWRVTYFGSLVSAPMATKVMFRFQHPSGAMIKPPDQDYFGGLFVIYGWPALMVAASAILAIRQAAGRLAIGTALG